MVGLRWLDLEDGTKVLQILNGSDGWFDIPTVKNFDDSVEMNIEQTGKK